MTTSTAVPEPLHENMWLDPFGEIGGSKRNSAPRKMWNGTFGRDQWAEGDGPEFDTGGSPATRVLGTATSARAMGTARATRALKRTLGSSDDYRTPLRIAIFGDSAFAEIELAFGTATDFALADDLRIASHPSTSPLLASTRGSPSSSPEPGRTTLTGRAA
ncbi:hypothetical protein VTI28DRAFT_8876 [Corynascus sepedonium]